MSERPGLDPLFKEPVLSTEPEPETPSYPLLSEPADGVPEVVTSAGQLARCCEAIRGGTGPVAIDAERASGYRYGGEAYLVQIRREGSGTWLIDPVPCHDLRKLDAAIGDAEWVLHAATQDLPCLRELGLHPKALFDTELAGRLAGLPRVGLAAETEHYLGVTLAKEHSAVDWSTRPLPQDWLVYAALDVERLVDLRDAVAADLEAQGKSEWARQEFAALLDFTGPAPKTDPWRRTSGLNGLRGARALERVKQLWQTRDEIARRRDTAPGRVLPDALLVDLAKRAPTSSADLVGPAAIRPGVRDGGASRRRRPRPPHRGLARYGDRWIDAIKRAEAVPDRLLPETRPRTSAPPPVRAWADRDPVAAARLEDVKAGLQEFSERRNVPVENLLTPDVLRRCLWTPPTRVDEVGWAEALRERGARPWQVEIVAPLLARAAAEHPAR